jgi:hypothetical protein
MPDLIRHPLAVDYGGGLRHWTPAQGRSDGVPHPRNAEPLRVMPDLIRHPLAVESGTGFRDQVAE